MQSIAVILPKISSTISASSLGPVFSCAYYIKSWRKPHSDAVPFAGRITLNIIGVMRAEDRLVFKSENAGDVHPWSEAYSRGGLLGEEWVKSGGGCMR